MTTKSFVLLPAIFSLWLAGLGNCYCAPTSSNEISTVTPPNISAMTIFVDSSYPAGSRDWLNIAASDVWEAVHNRFIDFPASGIRPIICIYNPEAQAPENPVIGNANPYIIKLTVKDILYDQFTYQLSHELGHVMLDSRRDNGLIETCATAVSYQTLDDLSVRWATEPPFEQWRSYAPNFTKYRIHEEDSHLSNFPPEVISAVKSKEWDSVSLYLRFRRQDQDDNSVNRDLNSLGAMALRSQTINWREMANLGMHTIPPPAQSPRHSGTLQTDLKSLPASMQSLFQVLGRGCNSEMAAAYFDSKPNVPNLSNSFLFQTKEGWVWLLQSSANDHNKSERIILNLKPTKYSWDINEKVSLVTVSNPK